jgi:hypothetical protein
MPNISSKDAALNQQDIWLYIKEHYIAPIWIAATIVVLIVGSLLLVVWRRI